MPLPRDPFDIPDRRRLPQLRVHGTASGAGAVEAGERALADKARPWRVGVGDFFEPVAALRPKLAGVLGGDAAGIALTSSVSYGVAVAANNLPVRSGQQIVVLAEQFPSNVYAWRELARRNDAEVVVVERPPDRDWTSGDRPSRLRPNRHRRRAGLSLDRRNDRRSPGRGRTVPRGRGGAGGRRLPGGRGDAPRRGPDRSGLRRGSGLQVAARPIQLGVSVGRTSPSRRRADRVQLDHPGRERGLRRRWSTTATSTGRAPDGTTPARSPTSSVWRWPTRRWTTWPTSRRRRWPSTAGPDNPHRWMERQSWGSRCRRSTCGHPIWWASVFRTGWSPAAVAAHLSERQIHVSVRGSSVRISAHLWNTADDIDRLLTALAEL